MIVCSDYSTGSTITNSTTVGYSGTGCANVDVDYTTVSYLNGQTYLVPTVVRYNYTYAVDSSCDWQQPTGTFLNSSNCTATSTTWYGGQPTYRVVKYQQVCSSDWPVPKIPTPAERLKEIMAKRYSPNFIRDRHALGNAPDIREIRARQTLRRVIGDDKFRDFIKKGFISVRAKSGKTYQIFPGHGLTNVYFCGKMVERLCVVMSGEFPQTDSVIMRYLMVLNNEDQFRGLANVSTPISQTLKLPKEPDKRTLVEIFAAFKKAA